MPIYVQEHMSQGIESSFFLFHGGGRKLENLSCKSMVSRAACLTSNQLS